MTTFTLDSYILIDTIYNNALEAETAKLHGNVRRALNLGRKADELINVLAAAATEAGDFDAVDDIQLAARSGRNEARRRFDLEPRPYYAVHEDGRIEERIGNNADFDHYVIAHPEVSATRDAASADIYAQAQKGWASFAH